MNGCTSWESGITDLAPLPCCGALWTRSNPRCVLIEGPPEADQLIAFAGATGMKPPIALLVHASRERECGLLQSVR